MLPRPFVASNQETSPWRSLPHSLRRRAVEPTFCVASWRPNARTVHSDVTRNCGVLQDWTEGLFCEVTDVIEGLARRNPNIRRLAFTEMPKHDRVSMSILTGKVSSSSGNPTNDVQFHGLEVLTVKDAELSDGSIGQLSEDNESLDSTSLVRTMGPTNAVLAGCASQPGRVVLRPTMWSIFLAKLY